MKKLFLILMVMFSFAVMGQELVTTKVVIINDSILEMGKTNGRHQLLIPAPVATQSVIITSIDIRYKVNDRLYSPDTEYGQYSIGYQKGSYWYPITTLPFTDLNATSNTTVYYSATLNHKFWDNSQTDGAPIMIKFESPMNFGNVGSNRLTLYITYRVLN